MSDSTLPAHEPMLPVETVDLTKRYGPRAVVDHVGLQVRSGEVYGFLGPNGAGKTTTLRLLLGLVRASSGSARVLGAAPGAPAALARIGMLVEAPAFYPYLSGRDNLRVFARYASVPTAKVDEVLEAVDLTDRAKDRASSYSLGMKQRLGVAAALLKDPELLILDEPTSGLDPAGMAEMRTMLRRLGTGGRTVLWSSHLLGEVQQVCDRVGVINQGRLLRQATVGELLGHGSLRVAAEPLQDARTVAERLFGVRRVRVFDGTLDLDVDDDQALRVNRELVLAGVAGAFPRLAPAIAGGALLRADRARRWRIRMIASFLAELLKLARRPAVWPIVGVWMTLSLVFGYVFPYFSYRGTPPGPVRALTSVSGCYRRRCRPRWCPPQSKGSRCSPARSPCCWGAGHRWGIRLGHPEGPAHPGPTPAVGAGREAARAHSGDAADRLGHLPP
jgi:ABC-type multidrug transport system ATPase subunit